MKTHLQKIGLTPAKGAAILLLGGLLLAIWGPQLIDFGSAKGPSVAGRSPTPAFDKENAALPADLDPSVLESTSLAAQREIPVYDLESTAMLDPFALPDWSPEKPRSVESVAGDTPVTPDVTAKRFEALRTQGVSMLLVSSGGATATVGDRVLHVGDEIDGFRVVRISPEGVFLQPSQTPSSTDPKAETYRTNGT